MADKHNLADVLLKQTKNFEDNYPVMARAYEKIAERLSSAKAGKSTPTIGDKLPPFLLPDDKGVLQALDDLLATGPLVISLNRGHWCNFCQHELDALQLINKDVQALGGSIVAITPERQKFAKRLKSERNLEFPVLCDVNNAYALLLGLAVWCGEEIISIYKNFEMDIGRYQNNRDWLLPIPATFIISQEGIIVGSYINADFRFRMEPADILAVLRKSI